MTLMQTVSVNVRRAETPGGAGAPALELDVERARKLARLMDSQFSIAGVQFGLDAIAGLVPVAGDLVTTLVACYPVWVARRHNLGRTLQARMMLNVLVDGLAGAVPILGDMVDVAYKANLKNLKLLERAVERRRKK